jgi:hypothetical protein
MTPGTVVHIVEGAWAGRVGIVETFDPEWAGFTDGAVLVRLYAMPERPQLERVVVLNSDVEVVDLRGPV